jgi:hypothetical protein
MDITTAQLWSVNDQALATWSVGLVEETDDGGNVSNVIKVTYNDEVLRFSPNYTDDELTAAFAAYNTEMGAS